MGISSGMNFPSRAAMCSYSFVSSSAAWRCRTYLSYRCARLFWHPGVPLAPGCLHSFKRSDFQGCQNVTSVSRFWGQPSVITSIHSRDVIVYTFCLWFIHFAFLNLNNEILWETFLLPPLQPFPSRGCGSRIAPAHLAEPGLARLLCSGPTMAVQLCCCVWQADCPVSMLYPRR